VRGPGRRGRRTGTMVRIAHERIDELFALAAREAGGPDPRLADRYVTLARKVGTRYNVRLRPEYRELYCRRCSVYWVEGRTVRTRIASGRRSRTCLSCGEVRRTRIRPPPSRTGRPIPESTGAGTRPDGALVSADDLPDEPEEAPDDDVG